MSTTADVVVVGAGVVGASTAFHLATRGVKKVVVCERRRAEYSRARGVMLG